MAVDFHIITDLIRKIIAQEVTIDWVDSVLDKDLTTPPANPSQGDRYLIPSGATGKWANKENQIAEYYRERWRFTISTKGCATYVEDEGLNYLWNGTNWVKISAVPTNHKTTHQVGGADEINVGNLSGELADKQKSDFLKLTDTPASYTGQARKGIGINTTEDALEFINIILGVAEGYKLARGETSVTGSADIATGLGTVVVAVACLKDDIALDGAWVSIADSATAGNIILRVWKPTSATDCTPIAATVAKTVRWIAVGT